MKGNMVCEKPNMGLDFTTTFISQYTVQE